MFTTINGHTIETMQAKIRKHVGAKRTMHLEGHSCVFKDEAGKRCAVGAFMPDDSCEASFQHRGAVDDLLRSHPTLLEHMPLELDGLEALQAVHDGAEDDENTCAVICQWVEDYVENA